MSSPQDTAVVTRAAATGPLADRPAREGRTPLAWLGATIRMDRLHRGVLQTDASRAFSPDGARGIPNLTDVELGRTQMSPAQASRLERIIGVAAGRYDLASYEERAA